MGSPSDSKPQNDYSRIDLSVVVVANAINLMMAALFAARLTGLTQVQYGFGVVAMVLGFALGYATYVNNRSKRDKWMTWFLLPIFLFFVIDLFLDYVWVFNFRDTIIVGPYILLYYVGLWGLIGYGFKFDEKCGFITLATYFVNMTLSILPYI